MVEEGWKKDQKMGINNNNCLAALGQVTPFPGPSGVWENMFHSFYFTQPFPWVCFSIELLSKLKLLWSFDNSTGILFSAL